MPRYFSSRQSRFNTESRHVHAVSVALILICFYCFSMMMMRDRAHFAFAGYASPQSHFSISPSVRCWPLLAPLDSQSFKPSASSIHTSILSPSALLGRIKEIIGLEMDFSRRQDNVDGRWHFGEIIAAQLSRRFLIYFRPSLSGWP